MCRRPGEARGGSERATTKEKFNKKINCKGTLLRNGRSPLYFVENAQLFPDYFIQSCLWPPFSEF